jgi:hypothetical protein
MSYTVLRVPTDGDPIIYGRIDSDGLIRVSCFASDKSFQQWLKDNADNLPADIQAQVEAGTLVIQEAE